jgi:hypothetical protein
VCFSLGWLENFLIWLVVVCAVVALIQLLLRFVIPHLGLGAPVLEFIIRALWIVLWAVICIAAVIFVFSLISCLWPMHLLR